MKTLDEIQIEKLLEKRAKVIEKAQAEIKLIDAKIAYYQSAPRYARPKRPKTLSEAQRLRRENDAKLMADIARQRAEADAELRAKAFPTLDSGDSHEQPSPDR